MQVLQIIAMIHNIVYPMKDGEYIKPDFARNLSPNLHNRPQLQAYDEHGTLRAAQ